MTEPRTKSFAAKPWQAKISRRRFIGTGAALAGAAAAAGYLPSNIGNAAMARAGAATMGGSIDLSQIKHLVFLMQENRSFDHYFGTFPKVAGFSDRNALKLSDGRSVFQQMDPANPDGFLEPYHFSTITTGAAAVPSLSHNWGPQHTAWNDGQMDGWLRAHIASDGPTNGQYTMGYYTQEDIPFHWALAEAFTLLDQYHCSVMGPTDPNRTIWQNGNLDPAGLAGGPVLETVTPPPLTFESGAETLFNAGITFHCYLSGGPNTWAFFAKLMNGSGSPAALINSANQLGTLFGNGTPGGKGDPNNPTKATIANMSFEEDCANGVLPDVSFIGDIASEHPPAIPAAGAASIASLLDALTANEDLWNTTLFILNYDENDGFFDHVPPPVPDPSQFPEEFVTVASVAGTAGGGQPIGAGFRVPAMVISPWSTGGQIFSQVSDHTSCLRLIESVAAAGGLSGTGPIRFPNISRWRRQTFSDLTGALSGAAQSPPVSPEFDPAARAAELAAQQASSALPLPPVPGATQTKAVQVKTVH